MSRNHRSNRDQVINYYARNWEAIAHCYDLDADGYPIDVAWYRRQIYMEIIQRRNPATLLDVGCGGGWTVLDALNSGIDALGLEPVSDLVLFGKDLLQQNSFDADHISQGEIASLNRMENECFDALSFLSVLPHVDEPEWDSVHCNASRLLRPGGLFVAAYRNALFDLYTFNRFTVEFVQASLWPAASRTVVRNERLDARLAGLLTHPSTPHPDFTRSADVSFGRLKRVKSNPLEIEVMLAKNGLRLDRIHFYHIHCVPPLLEDAVKNVRQVNHELELKLSQDWRGNFMAAMFLVEATKI